MNFNEAKQEVALSEGYGSFEQIPSHLKDEYYSRAHRLYLDNFILWQEDDGSFIPPINQVDTFNKTPFYGVYYEDNQRKADEQTGLTD